MHLGRFMGVAVAVGVLTGACSRVPETPPRAPRPPLPFADVYPTSGVDWETHSGRGLQTNIQDTIGHGVALVDFDRDGLVDLVFTGRDRVAAYRNLGQFRFAPVEIGLRQQGHWGGAATADVNNDGWPDLYLTGYGCGALYLNDHGRFREVTDSGIRPLQGKYPAWGTSAGFADLDGDGWADLVVCYYLQFGPDLPQRCKSYRAEISSVCPPKVYEPQHPRVYRNLAGRRFQDITDAWRFHGHGATLGVAFQDMNGDGRTDVALSNDERPGDLFLNQGPGFREIGAESGTAYDRQGRVHGGMGLDWADVDADGRPDLAVMTFTGEDKSVYRNLDGRFFEDIGWKLGITGPMRVDIGFGARFLDYDNDGRMDLIVANGHIQENAGQIRPEEQYEQPLRLFHHTGTSLDPVGEGAWPALVGRALATGDLDNDGGVDGVVTNLEGRPLLLRNVAVRGHWLGLNLVGRKSNRMALGARVTVTAGGAARRYEVHTAGSYMSASDPRLVVGLGSAGVERVRVDWPAGGRSELRPSGTDRWITIDEAESTPTR